MFSEGFGSKAKNRVLGKLFIDRNRDYRNTVFLAGAGRGGTTWVSEIINYDGRYRYIFEPFHPGRVKSVRSFRHKQYIRPDNRDGKYLKPAWNILSGKVRSSWTDRFYKGRFVYDRRLVKDIRMNLALYWLRRNFPEMPIILLLRHPCAVAASRMKLGWRGSLAQTYLSQRELVEDFLAPFEREIQAAEERDFDRYIFGWCIENYVPLRQFSEGELLVVFYENFCERPREEVARTFRYLGRGFDDSVFAAMREPSPLARKESAVLLGERPADGWKRHVTPEQTKRAVEILALFGLDGVYSEDPMPDPGAVKALLRAK
ncbi:hypothetical protein E0L93_13200 [Rubrobacter taiwanensis]|uniref:Sulfotransferase domain-containing protein n=1 Tax=Rubrobacter taiwanensis TaxID=185139 RepID=A0A4R1BDU6_9ACTN|nr:sulfotransferase [Rubrobacter taiwanensis]TCJ15261.1 hypothetical protein E0L93_13200 [Rubrobacter taiwanensis]